MLTSSFDGVLPGSEKNGSVNSRQSDLPVQHAHRAATVERAGEVRVPSGKWLHISR